MLLVYLKVFFMMEEMYEDSYPYDDVEDNYDQVYLEEMDANYFQDNIEITYSIQNIWEDCLHPTLNDGFNSSFRLLMCCLLLKFIKSLNYLPSSVIHLTSAGTGLYCLYYFFEELIIYVIILAIIGYLTLAIVHITLRRYCGYVCFAVCFTFLIICELFIVIPTQWHRIRGSQMILAMKIISLGFDIDCSLKFPSLIECIGYYFCVGSIIFGPWVSFANYMKLLQERSVVSFN
ncbi:protein-serine O-palmitoleoyltransferase porcupine-like [Centruroides sculpturatus]|uniref:protein-serine O-palmitoleoyltransferase porcupine-like n=1 Tax=Centruroides sculpturatus TaxID=218467 RepID=UPI000C6D2E7F|nr:protein-serine O-palmitoleoyltransferase porcupine-like [Centruroides sculpturatus]